MRLSFSARQIFTLLISTKQKIHNLNVTSLSSGISRRTNNVLKKVHSPRQSLRRLLPLTVIEKTCCPHIICLICSFLISFLNSRRGNKITGLRSNTFETLYNHSQESQESTQLETNEALVLSSYTEQLH